VVEEEDEEEEENLTSHDRSRFKFLDNDLSIDKSPLSKNYSRGMPGKPT